MPSNSFKFMALTTVATVALMSAAVPVWAQSDPLVLSNDTVGATGAPLGATRPAAYWDVKQADTAEGIKACTVTKSAGRSATLRLTAGDYVVTQVDLTADTLQLPKTATVPVVLSFDRALPSIQATGQIQGPGRLIVKLPEANVAYDRFSQASVLQVRVANGADAPGTTFDLGGLKTALGDAAKCLSAAPSTPMPSTLQRAAPPPVPARTPDAIADNFDGGLPDVTTGTAAIPPLEWPEIEASAKTAKPQPSVRMTDTKALDDLSGLPPASMPSDEPYSPALAKVAQARAASQTRAPTSAEMMPMRGQLVVEGPAPMVPPPVSVAGTVSNVSTQHVVDTFRARKGESLRDVLRRWADRAGVDLVWTMPSDIILEQDYSFVGAFNGAVTGLLSAYPQSGIKTTLAPQGTGFERQPYVEEGRAPVAAPAPVPADVPDLNDFVPNPPPAAAATPAAPVRNQPYASVMENPSSGVAAHPPAMATALAPAAIVPPPVSRPVSPLPMKADVNVTPTMPPATPPVAAPALIIPTQTVIAPTPSTLVAEQPRPMVAAPRVILPPETNAMSSWVAASAAQQQARAAQPAPSVVVGPTRRWRALSGASMRQVMQAWAEDAQVTLVWQAREDFAVRLSVNQSTDFGHAIADLLGQYAHEPVRPQGQIYQDPQTGNKTLVIRVTR